MSFFARGHIYTQMVMHIIYFVVIFQGYSQLGICHARHLAIAILMSRTGYHIAKANAEIILLLAAIKFLA